MLDQVGVRDLRREVRAMMNAHTTSMTESERYTSRVRAFAVLE